MKKFIYFVLVLIAVLVLLDRFSREEDTSPREELPTAEECLAMMEDLQNVEKLSPYCQWLLVTWRTGDRTKVLAEAEKRLAADENDLAGLMIKAGWAMYYCDVMTASNALFRVNQEIPKVKTPLFKVVSSWTRTGVQMAQIVNARMTPEKYAREQKKGQQKGYPFFFETEFEALDRDGYFQGEIAPERIDPQSVKMLRNRFNLVSTDDAGGKK